MGKLRWYKRDPVAALEGMSDLSLEEKGAYNTVLDLIYARDGKVDDDDRFIAGWLRCDVRVWRRIKKQLLERGKLYVDDGSLRNSRADAEVSRGLSLVASASEAGKASARSKSDVKSKNKDLDTATVETTVPTNSTTTTTSTPELRSGTRKRARARAPMPDDWVLTPVDIAHARERGFTDQQIQPMARAFANHHRAKGSLMADWGAAWRTWCENEIKFARPVAGTAPRPGSKDDTRERTVNALRSLDPFPYPDDARRGEGAGPPIPRQLSFVKPT